MQANEVKKERKPMTPEQLEALKARLMKAREAKIERDKKRYEYNKEEVKIEMVKKRAFTMLKAFFIVWCAYSCRYTSNMRVGVEI